MLTARSHLCAFLNDLSWRIPVGKENDVARLRGKVHLYLDLRRLHTGRPSDSEYCSTLRLQKEFPNRSTEKRRLNL